MSTTVDTAPADTVAPSSRSLWPWLVAVTAFVALVGAGSFRAAPSVLIEPLQADFGWSRGTISAAVMVNLILYGLTSPFPAAPCLARRPPLVAERVGDGQHRGARGRAAGASLPSQPTPRRRHRGVRGR